MLGRELTGILLPTLNVPGVLYKSVTFYHKYGSMSRQTCKQKQLLEPDNVARLYGQLADIAKLCSWVKLQRNSVQWAS